MNADLALLDLNVIYSSAAGASPGQLVLALIPKHSREVVDAGQHGQVLRAQ